MAKVLDWLSAILIWIIGAGVAWSIVFGVRR